jgi:ribonucleoside-diphosphate reductase beta chain
MTAFNLKATNHLLAKMFFDENGGVGTARYDVVKYPEVEHFINKQLGFFWLPQEVDLNGDRGDFGKLSPHEKHIFSSNLKRQIVLDSVQGRAPTATFAPITALPEMETWAQTWAFFETIHSRSYTHIIRQVYSNPSEIFDDMTSIPEIVDCATDISHYYDDFMQYSLIYQLCGFGVHVVNGKAYDINPYAMKRKLWLTLASVNILEGIRFYVSFACSWAFAETKRMEGNAKIIKLIARDENLHLGFTQQMMRTILPGDDDDFAKIKVETEDEVREMFRTAMDQEKAWAKYLFKDGSIIGLNEALLCEYVDYIGAVRMKAIGMKPDFESPARDPLPWTASWISSKTVQVAPQETEITSYVTGGVKQDAGMGDFGGFSL